MEKKLFVNTIIAAYNAQAVNPELMFVKQSDRNAAQEKTVYYTLDNVNFNESQELIKNKPLEFHLKVTDSTWSVLPLPEQTQKTKTAIVYRV